MKPKAKKRIGQQIIDSLQEAVDSLRGGASLEETFTCHRVDVDVKPGVYDPEVAKGTRKLLCASQSVFATFLGVSLQTVRAWEQGENVPSDMAKRFMDEIRLNPDYWRARLRQVVSTKKGVRNLNGSIIRFFSPTHHRSQASAIPPPRDSVPDHRAPPAAPRDIFAR